MAINQFYPLKVRDLTTPILLQYSIGLVYISIAIYKFSLLCFF